LAPKKKRKSIPASQVKQGQKEAGAAKRPGSALIKTCLLFAVYMVVFHAVLQIYSNLYHVPLRDGTASIVSAMLNAIGVTNTVESNNIFLRYDKWVVTSECTAINAVFLFASFVLAYPSSMKAKLLALVPGIPFIFVANIARLVVLGWITDHWPRYAQIIHDYVWESIFLFMIVALWLIWLKLVVNREQTPDVSC
jgi:exosortase/archaeosortase family protein